MIYFDEPSHTYRLDDPINGELCTSATTLLSLFHDHYDLEYWSWYTALRHILNMEKKPYARHLIKDYGFSFDAPTNKDNITEIAFRHTVSYDQMLYHQNIVKDLWKKENKKSTDKGTKFHNYKEDQVYKNSGLFYKGEYTKVGTNPDLSNLCSPAGIVIHPELRMYNRKYRISGTADKIFAHPNRVIDIDDWKTNKEIKMESHNGKYKMKGPLSHLQDCNHVHYCLQVSLYMWMLEQWGYEPGDFQFTHVELEEDGLTIKNHTVYTTHYMKYEVEAMLEYFDKNRDQMLLEYKLYKESLE